MKHLMETMALNSVSSYEKLNRPTFTLNGQEYEVRNCYSEEEMKEAEYYILKDEQGIETFFLTPKGISAKMERELRLSGLDAEIDNHTLEAYEASEQWQKVIKSKAIEFINNPEGWFFIGGQVGSGKSHICDAIAISIMRQGKSLKHMIWIDEVNRLKYHMEDNHLDMERYIEADVLYIDDLFKKGNSVTPSNIELELAYQILDARYRQRKVTIISTEKTLREILGYDQAIHRRIVEMSQKFQIQIGKDEAKNYSLKQRKGQ